MRLSPHAAQALVSPGFHRNRFVTSSRPLAVHGVRVGHPFSSRVCEAAPVVASAPLLFHGTSRYQLLHLSCHPAPGGSLPAFAWGNVARMGDATPIRPITGRHLSWTAKYRAFASSTIPYPQSHRLALRLAFPEGRTTGLPRSARVPARVRPLLYAGGAPSAIGGR